MTTAGGGAACKENLIQIYETKPHQSSPVLNIQTCSTIYLIGQIECVLALTWKQQPRQAGLPVCHAGCAYRDC